MKRLLLTPLLFLLSSCSYGSFYEARGACYEWREKGGTYKYEKYGKSRDRQNRDTWRKKEALMYPSNKPERLNTYENEFLLIDLNNPRTAEEIVEENTRVKVNPRDEILSPVIIRSKKLRDCIHESKTKQYLGFESQELKKGAYYKVREEIPESRVKLVKRFRY